ncbi:MAG: TIGR02301 family protein [Robiginitomaculum sp.]|nr:MAG: TIGR02301 family protein [Robiginitomaculum sp.]
MFMKHALILALLIFSAPAQAQTQALEPLTDIEKAETRIDENMVTMSSLVEALADNLGQLHYLRTLCFSDDDQQWRNTANAMMAIESPQDSTRRRKLVRAFNAGYYQQKERYKSCSNTVAIDVAALAENGRRLSVMLGDPYRE